ncbi:gamma-tubulin complex component 4-like [Lytechinus variegatus]|uniref:gamma-tubulin complex component 4-like n=1 Tax=Lytechinus variegatus TaxID=7654 RepID=UPI001BB2B651|nr:gamma-tubulin complex component 4-like [Lytechinus variegatus]
MLHDLLMALNGFPGGIFMEHGHSDLQVVPDLPFIHVSEVSVLNRVCRLGAIYKNLQTFIKRYSGSPHLGEHNQETKSVDRLADGLYLRTFCSGLDKVLEPYRKTLLDLEQDILADPNLTVGHVQHTLEPFQSLFPALLSLAQQIQTQGYHGGQILDLLQRHCDCGQPVIQKALQKILFACHCVMYRQVTAWLLHGMLLDRHAEFFIHQTTDPGQLLTPSPDDDDLGLGGVTSRQLQDIMQLSEDGISSETEHSRFAIHPAMLPSYIPARAADKILFVGESVQMFESKKQSTAMKYTDSVLGENEAEFASRLHDLQEKPIFMIQDFEDAVDEIRVCVAEHLWKLVVEEFNLVGKLNMFKDFFLLGRGELFLAFIDQAQTLLKNPATSTTEHDVNVAFQQAAHKILFDDDTSLSRFRLTISGKISKPASKKSEGSRQVRGIGESGWSCLGMTFAVQWPLHILFTQSVLERYNMLFRFLLNVKRVQLELQQCWAVQMQHKHQNFKRWDAAQWRLRSHMAFLIDNLQYYLQVDVLETHFIQLLQKIELKRDFEAVRLAHDQFLVSLITQCFLLTKPVHHCLTEILDLCYSFCSLMMQTSTVTDRELTHMDKLAQGFNRQSSLLFKILSGVRNHHASPHLTQLLLRLDFNKYYSQAEGALAR